ncbi:MAG: hypothetical protein HFJ55_03140 [Clostridia bacterium]|nr:hypothetical protein [Clostridia bacterium]
MDKRRTRSRSNRRREKRFNWTILAKITLIIGFVFLATFFSLLNMGNSNIINNVYINGIPVSTLSTEDAKNKLEKVTKEKLEKEISIKFDGYEASILPAEIDFSYDLSSAIEEAYGLGRTGNIVTNNLKILSSFFKKTDIKAPIIYNSEKLDNIVENMSLELPDLVVEPTYYISNNELIITKGTEGNKLDKQATKEIIISSIDKENSFIELPISNTKPTLPDLAKIHDDIYTEPQNASIKKEPYSISVEKQGVDFAISVEEAQNLVNSSKENEIAIPLSFTPAEITVADLGEDIFANTITSSTTKYDSTNTNRATNLEIAVNKINGTVLAPGEIFSFNKVVGERSVKSGFKEAIIYVDGEMDYGLGGGICQISSNLYNTVLMANLEIVERKNHSMTVNYVPIGCDATVAYGSIDFKFKNSRSYPIKIVATINSGVITISICGVKEENEYSTDIIVETTQKENFETVYEHSSSIPKGTQVIKQTGKEGYKCSTYRVLYQNGKMISKDLLSTDTYKPQKEIIQTNK